VVLYYCKVIYVMEVNNDTSSVPYEMTEWGDIHRSCGTSSGHIDLHSTQYSPQMENIYTTSPATVCSYHYIALESGNFTSC
jgi:hypothetical protein